MSKETLLIACYYSCFNFPVRLHAGFYPSPCRGCRESGRRIDGDSIRVMHEGQAEQIRLFGIDCPEKRQPFGTRAKE